MQTADCIDLYIQINVYGWCTILLGRQKFVQLLNAGLPLTIHCDFKHLEHEKERHHFPKFLKISVLCLDRDRLARGQEYSCIRTAEIFR